MGCARSECLNEGIVAGRAPTSRSELSLRVIDKLHQLCRGQTPWELKPDQSLRYYAGSYWRNEATRER